MNTTAIVAASETDVYISRVIIISALSFVGVILLIALILLCLCLIANCNMICRIIHTCSNCSCCDEHDRSEKYVVPIGIPERKVMEVC